MRDAALGILFAAAIIGGSIYIGNTVVDAPDIGLALVAGVVSAVVCFLILSRDAADRRFQMKLFVAALLVRWLVGLAIYYKHQQNFLGADASTYDFFGNALCRSWQGLIDRKTPWLSAITDVHRSGWGMYYYVAALYYILGQNPLAVQLVNAVYGAASCILAYRIARMVWPEQRVSRWAAGLVAFSPSMILWSSQGLKDAPIVFCLCLCSLYTLKLREGFDVKNFLFLLLFLFCLFSLRHYVFYLVFFAVAGSLVVAGKTLTPMRILQGGILVILIGLALAYVGAGEVPQNTLNLKQIQAARLWGATVSNSGYGGEIDITDPQAALGFLPLGIIYMLFAPLPWMITNLRQLITLPELILWWALSPMLARGFWFALRHRLRASFAICVFTVGLTLAYALYQSNVGTAYRHRAQLYVFFSIFISFGLELRRSAKRKKLARIPLASPALGSLNPALGAPHLE
jgi:4-amino-4-deoxy-L-arabinose transferase-like glycosyltransferase